MPTLILSEVSKTDSEHWNSINTDKLDMAIPPPNAT